MKSVAKLILVDGDDNYLMMYRSDHPHYGQDPDLPGGTVEDGESTLEAMVREVEEEAQITIDPQDTIKLYEGTDYTKHGTNYVLYIVRLFERPNVVMSWEHSAYVWLPKEKFIEIASNAIDTYMHMTADILQKADAFEQVVAR